MNLEELAYRCQEPCEVILECGDKCSGTCGTCWQGRLHVPCQSDCKSILICEHSCKSPCRKLCPPCKEKCDFRCQHTECDKKCGVPCTPCQEPCEWKCKHSKCSRVCGEKCDREPCYEPCKLKIPSCGHDCVGFCGEPCPPLCRICDPELTENLFGDEDEPGARFVLLVDCNHTIVSTFLDKYFALTANDTEAAAIAVKRCPRCRTPVTKTLRYMNCVRQTYDDMTQVKEKIFGNVRVIAAESTRLAEKFVSLKDDLSFFDEVPILKKFWHCCCVDISNDSKKHPISRNTLRVADYYYVVLSTIVSRKNEFEKHNAEAFKLFNFLKRLLARLEQTNWCISLQEISDYDDELRRFHAIVDFCKILDNPLYKYNSDDVQVEKICATVRGILYGFTRFTQQNQVNVKQLFDSLLVELNCPKPPTAAERKMINDAMRLSFNSGSSGHWFKCSKGHIYCITECGGAMTTGNCPACGELIGGAHHSLVSTSTLAPEMDGAHHPAWSAGNIMANYEF